MLKWLKRRSKTRLRSFIIALCFGSFCISFFVLGNRFPENTSLPTEEKNANVADRYNGVQRDPTTLDHSLLVHPANLTRSPILTKSTRTETTWHVSTAHQTYVIKERPIIDRLFKINNRKVTGVNCKRLIQHQQHSVMRLRRTPTINVRNFQKATKNCAKFITRRGYVNSSLTLEEETFPIAFSLLVYKDVAQVERLLRAIYRPQHYYCVHVDNRSNELFKKEVSAIVGCFPNVFLTPRSVSVHWGEYSVLEPELICLESLWRFKSWRYFINLSGQEFPLKTNYELVKILKAFNGANDVGANMDEQRFERWWHAGFPPHDFLPIKGSVQMTASRAFVDYALHNPIAKDLLDWVKKTRIPDEAFFPTLNYNKHLQIPGSFKGNLSTHRRGPFLTRYKMFQGKPCAGKHVRWFCIFGVGDLPRLTSARHLYANKFHLDYQPVAYDCLEEWHFNRTRDYYYGKLHFDTTYYSSLDFVRDKFT